MPDGASGLSLSEIGAAAVKAGAKVVKPLIQQAQQQITGAAPQGMPMGGPAAQPPSEMAPQQSGVFDLSSFSDEKASFGQGHNGVNPLPNGQKSPQDLAATAARNQAEDQQKIEGLRKRLHAEQVREVMDVGEQKQTKEETVQQKLDREKEEEQQVAMQKQEEEKKKNELPFEIRGRQGAHEGLKQKG